MPASAGAIFDRKAPCDNVVTRSFSLLKDPDYGTVGVRPRTRLAMREIANRTIATKKTIFAASMATPAMPPKPSNAAIRATIRKVTAQPNIVVTSIVDYGTDAACRSNVNKAAMVPLWSTALDLDFRSFSRTIKPGTASTTSQFILMSDIGIRILVAI
jgi:hypothetical protein